MQSARLRLTPGWPLKGARPVLAPRQPLQSGRANLLRSTISPAAFGKGGSDKEDAARKALQDAFKGKKDPFAVAEERARKRGGGGGGGGSGGGGGGNGGGGGFNFSEWGDSFRKGANSFFKTVATILLFAAALGVMSLWRPALAMLGFLVRIVLRLDGNPRAQAARQQAVPQADLTKKDGLGNVEQAVVDKYAQDEDNDEVVASEDDA